MSKSQVVSKSQEEVLQLLLSSGTLNENKSNGELYIALSKPALQFNPGKQKAYDFLCSFETFAGYTVTKKTHTVYSTKEECEAVVLINPDFKPDWMIAAGL